MEIVARLTMLRQRQGSIAYVNMPRIAAIPENVADSGLNTRALVNSRSATVASTGTILPLSSLWISFVVVIGNPSPSFEQSCIAVH